jgi:hypothetical protein
MDKRQGLWVPACAGTTHPGGDAAAFLRHSRHRQSSPVTGIGRRAVSVSHQQSPDRLQVNSAPQRGQPVRREAGFGFSNRFVIKGILTGF